MNKDFNKNSPFMGLNIYNIGELIAIETLSRTLKTIENSESFKWENSEVYDYELGKTVFKEEFRNSNRVCFSSNKEEQSEEVKHITSVFESPLQQCIDNYLNEFKFNPQKGASSYEILKYGVDNYLVDHYDDGGETPLRVSILFYLNDDYEGGNIEWKFGNFNYKPKKGDVVIFPSSFIYRHQVYPVESGTRYVITKFLS